MTNQTPNLSNNPTLLRAPAPNSTEHSAVPARMPSGTLAPADAKPKLSKHTVWLFAFGSVAAAIATTYALSGLGQKATAAIYFAMVAIGGFASTYLTKARVGGAVLAFTATAAVAAGAYYVLVDHMFRVVTSTATDLVSNGAAHAQGVQAGAQFGHTFGIFVAAIVFLETIVAGIGGAIAGGKSRGAGGFAALGALAKSAR